MQTGEYGIKLIGLGSGELFPVAEWLVRFDANIHEIGKPYPTGMVESTVDPKKAMRFSSFGEAHELWVTQSTTVPFRPDGRPNRPLTAFTVEIVKIAEGGEEIE